MKSESFDVAQTVAVGLLICLGGAVLAFGGTEPLSWAAVEVFAFILFGFVLWHKGAGSPGVPWPWKGAALLLAYVAVQAAIVHPDGHRVREEILRILAYLCVFYVTLFVCSSRRSRQLFLFGLLGLGLFEALYGLVQYVSGWQQIFSYKKIVYTAQATGTYVNPNHFAGLLEMVLPLSFAWTLYQLERIGQSAKDSELVSKRSASGEGIAALVFYFFLTLLLFTAILYSRSRMGILAAGAAVVATGILWTSSSRRRSRPAIVVVCLLAGAGLLGLWIGLEPIVERYETIGADSLSRLAVWKDSLALIQAHPWWGSGLGSFTNAYTRVQSTLVSRVVDHAHNDYLELAVEWGLPGAALLMGLILLILGRAISASFHLPRSDERFLALGSSGSVLALLLHGLADFNLQIPANALVLATILGLGYWTSVYTTSSLAPKESKAGRSAEKH